MRAVVLVALAGCGAATIGDPPEIGGADARVNAPPPDATTTTMPDAIACTAGDARARDPSSGHCLAFFATATAWLNARDACAGLGGTLAVPTSAAEVNLLVPLSLDPVNAPDAWLGDNDRALEGTWVWIDGEAFVYDNWRTGEPNNGGTSGTPENCGVIETDTLGTWDDRPCDRVYPYYCELS